MSEEKKGYGSKSSDIKDTSYLSHGEHEGVHIMDVSAGLKKRSKSDVEDDVCDIIFKSKQGEWKKRVFNPDTGEDKEKVEKNQKYVSDLFAYILRKVHNKDVEIPDTISSWKELCDFFIKAMGSKEAYSKVSFSLKLVGNVYGGKANIDVTRYFGWLERTDSGKKPKLSPQEVGKNNEYDRFMMNKSSNTAGGESPTEDGGMPVF